MENIRKVYADNAATTAVSQHCLESMLPYFTEQYGNPSSLYSFGRENKKVLENARKMTADAIGAALADEIVFTSGGSESDNLAIKGYARANVKKGKHIISSKIEHHAVFETLDALKKEGFEITMLDVDSEGFVSPEALKNAMREDTILVTIMAANNEIGTVEPIAELAAIAHAGGAVFHTDAVQAVGHIPINVVEMGIDMLSMSAHKFNGPKGVGALYVKRGVRIQPMIHGGGQEKKRRSGTESVANIVGLATALTDAVERLPAESVRLAALRDKLIEGVMKMPKVILTGATDMSKRLPGTASFCINAIEGEALILRLDFMGICASTGSACSSGSLDPSHVLLALGLPHEVAHGSLRLSLGHFNTEQDVDYILEKLPQVVTALRAMSPVWQE